MNRAGDQFLTRSCLARDEHSRIGWRYGLHLLQHTAQGGAVSHNVRKVQLAANFIFQIQLLLRELVFERDDLTIGEGVLDRDSDLIGDLGQEIDLVLGKGMFLESGEEQHAKDTIAAQQWEKAARLQPLKSANLI